MDGTELELLDRLVNAVERIADHLDNLTDDDQGTVLRTTVVPR